jgi:uncharacterized protein (DUF169 family)
MFSSKHVGLWAKKPSRKRRMPKFEKQVERMVQALELRRMPVGARFSESPDRKGVDRKQRICEALNVVRQENVIVNLSKENCTCRAGCHIAGWRTLPPEELPAIFLAAKAYESKEVAEASVNKQPRPIYRGRFLILGPLDKFEADPDVVLFFVNPAQADRILGLASYEGAEPFMHYPVTSTCSAITYALAKGKPDINLISVFERRRGKWRPNELIITLPFKEFLIAVKSIAHSRYGRLPLSG